MPPDLRTWTCGKCKRTILVPPEGDDGRPGALARIADHRLAHFADTLMRGSDEDLLGMCEDEPVDQSADACLSRLGNLASCGSATPVDSDDVAPALESIAILLRDDLPRARRLWYPINEDGGFNR